jgi:hypothetical protein
MAAALLLMAKAAAAQELEPRSLTNVPVGMNFAALVYGVTAGDILLDPAVPIEDLNADLHTLTAAYVRAIDCFGLSGKVTATVPWAHGEWTGAVEGRDSSTARTGFGDARLKLSVNFVGAPAVRRREYAGFRERTIVGASLVVVTPVGQYDPSKLINLGSNRWAFRPQLGASHKAGSWILEAYAAAWLFTRNPDFFGGNYLTQKPLYAFTLHAIHTMPKRRIWMSAGAGYAVGGRTRVNDIETDTQISTFRFGLNFAVPVGTRHTFRLTGMTGVREQRGADFNNLALWYQFAWGG